MPSELHPSYIVSVLAALAAKVITCNNQVFFSPDAFDFEFFRQENDPLCEEAACNIAKVGCHGTD